MLHDADEYTTLPWPALCAEVAKVRISLREGKLLEMPARIAVGAESSLVTAFVTGEASRCNDKENGGADGTRTLVAQVETINHLAILQ